MSEDTGIAVGVGKTGDDSMVVIRSKDTTIYMNSYLARYIADAINRAAALLDGSALNASATGESNEPS